MLRTILVIDNVTAQREMLCSTLRSKLSYEPVGMTTIAQATQYVMTNQSPKPDAILFDVSQVENGSENVSTLRILANHAPIIVLVKFGDNETAQQMMNAGAQDFLYKPASIERIGTTLRNALQLRDMRREVEWLRHSRMQQDERTSFKAAQKDIVSSLSMVADDGNVRRMEEVEAEAIRFAMQFYDGRMTEVARRLGIGRSTLYRKLNDLSIRQTEAP